MSHHTDPDLPALVSLPQARAKGMTKDQVRQRVRSGEWSRVGRGWYLRASSLASGDEHAAHRTTHRMAAIAASLRLPGSTICGPSAALLHGAPLSRVPACVHLIAAPGGWTGQRAGLVLHEWWLPVEHVDLAPVRITTIPRTWVDLARVQGSVSGVIAGDHLLRLGAVDRAALQELIAGMAGCQLLGRAREALDLLDERRETPLESESACYFAAYGIPAPRWQVEIHDEAGFIGRVDCTWDGGRVVGEADGRWKYRTADDVYAEKRREDRIRATGREVIRWGRPDLNGPALALRLARLLGLPTPRVIRRGLL